MPTRSAQIEAGLGVANDFDIRPYIDDFETATVSSSIQAALTRFQELQFAVLERKGTKGELFRRMNTVKNELRKLYRDSSDQEGQRIIDCLVYIGVTMRVSLGKRKVDYVNNLPKKRKVKK